MKDITVAELVKLYGLQPHPEGGYFKETYRSSESIPGGVLPKRGNDRNFSTGIYFLLPEGSVSKLHRIKSDEMWHFYLGGPLTIAQITPSGKIEQAILGQDVKSGQKVQYVVPSGYWFGAYPNAGSKFSFVGCTVAPGFDFADFEMGNKAGLLKEYHQ
ncbi:MAG: cupin domain-containing protein, partial [Deltaproteobacteria bacterium]|nr:cupin domain-containing protein [Deltaproteobacteria bacterium]